MASDKWEVSCLETESCGEIRQHVLELEMFESCCELRVYSDGDTGSVSFWYSDDISSIIGEVDMVNEFGHQLSDAAIQEAAEQLLIDGFQSVIAQITGKDGK